MEFSGLDPVSRPNFARVLRLCNGGEESMTNADSLNSTTPRPGLTIEVEAVDLDRDGKGVARWNNWVIVVPGLLPGERAKVQLQQRQRSRWLSRRVESVTVSRDRRRPPCILANDCGGCTLQHLDDPAQTRWKAQQIQQTMQRIGGIDHAPAEPLIDPTRFLGYRNRALIPLKRDQNGTLKAGYFRPRSHKIVNLNHCPVLDPRLDQLVEPIKCDLDATGWPADHDLIDAKGLRHLGLRLGHGSGDVLITLISSHTQLPGLERLAQTWLKRWPAVKGVCLNLQPTGNNLVLGKTTHCIAGQPTIEEQFCGIKLSLSSTTFVQVNTPQAERIVQQLTGWLLAHQPGAKVVDAYCGVGTIALPLARAGFNVQGLELNPDSVEQARLNAMHNGLSSSCAFQAGDVAELLGSHLGACQALVLDPPRRGLDGRVVESILEQPPVDLAYLSCDPATQARDLKALMPPAGPYRLEALQPIDFFPQTTHLESLALLKRINS